MPGLYPTAYRATFPAFLCGWLQFVSTVCVFLFMFSILSRRCPLLATSLSVLFCLLSMLISDSRFDLVWFRLSCDHGWIRSGSINVRKQQQQQQPGAFTRGFTVYLIDDYSLCAAGRWTSRGERHRRKRRTCQSTLPNSPSSRVKESCTDAKRTETCVAPRHACM